jgi:ATP-dependent DNA helicase RecG
LREAFVNALIHADYAGAGGIVIERHPDRFIVENPGTLLVSIEQYLTGGVSECRNRALQQMFLMIGGGERAGSGADKIRAGWSAQHWRAPKLEIRSEPDRVRLALSMISLIPDETLDSLQQRFGSRTEELTPVELQALATAHLEGAVSNARLQQLVADHPVDITRMLAGLCERGWLVSDNRRRWTTYRLPGAGSAEPSLFPGDSSHLAGDSSRSEEESKQLRTIAMRIAGRGKVPPELMKRTIRELCTGRFLTAEELAALLDRTAANLRSRCLTPMVREGLLRLRYPEATNRPDQAYTAEQES